jgi:hypothetical protein
MIMVAYIMASKYIHDSLRLIIYTNNRTPSSIEAPITPPTSPKIFTTANVNTIQYITTTITNNDSKPSSAPLAKGDDTIVHQKDESAPSASHGNDRNVRIARMEQEFLFFLNYDLSVQDPPLLVRWAQMYQEPEKKNETEEEYTSADEGDDEMDDEEEK